jgi:hypothetical protein
MRPSPSSASRCRKPSSASVANGCGVLRRFERASQTFRPGGRHPLDSWPHASQPIDVYLHRPHHHRRSRVRCRPRAERQNAHSREGIIDPAPSHTSTQGSDSANVHTILTTPQNPPKFRWALVRWYCWSTHSVIGFMCKTTRDNNHVVFLETIELVCAPRIRMAWAEWSRLRRGDSAREFVGTRQEPNKWRDNRPSCPIGTSTALGLVVGRSVNRLPSGTWPTTRTDLIPGRLTDGLVCI